MSIIVNTYDPTYILNDENHIRNVNIIKEYIDDTKYILTTSLKSIMKTCVQFGNSNIPSEYPISDIAIEGVYTIFIEGSLDNIIKTRYKERSDEFLENYIQELSESFDYYMDLNNSVSNYEPHHINPEVLFHHNSIKACAYIKDLCLSIKKYFQYVCNYIHNGGDKKIFKIDEYGKVFFKIL